MDFSIIFSRKKFDKIINGVSTLCNFSLGLKIINVIRGGRRLLLELSQVIREVYKSMN